MFGMMTGDRVEVTGDIAYKVMAARDSSIRKSDRDIYAVAAADADRVAVMVWNYHDLNIISPAATVNIVVQGIKVPKVDVHHYRIDQENSNSYEVWKKMGSPQVVSNEQYATLEQSSRLKLIEGPKNMNVEKDELVISVPMEGQAVSLFVIEW